MATYRTLFIDFWADSKIDDEFTPEDKYFYLYLLTNPHTNTCGCYEISKKQFERETGYSIDTIKRLLDRLENQHNVIKYSEITNEILILKWHKYNWSTSEKLMVSVKKFADKIKCKEFKDYVYSLIDEKEQEEIPYTYHIDTSVTVTDTINNNVTSIIEYLNIIAGTNYKATAETNKKHIRARLNEGYSLEDFKIVIDKKCKEWKNTDWEKYLRPETLFGSKFDNYLNQKVINKNNNVQDAFSYLEEVL